MTLKYGFFNSVNGDRTYQADDFNYLIKNIVSNGVFMQIGSNLQVAANGSMSVNVYDGAALLDWHYFYSDAPFSLKIDDSEATLDRMDRVVVRLSRTNRRIEFAVLKGTPATNPVAPSVTRSSEIYELGLATVLVRKRASAINGRDVTDTRLDSRVCGVVAAIVDHIDTSKIYEQFTTQAKNDRTENQIKFDAFMNQLKASLGDTPATALDAKITQDRARLTTLEARPTIFAGTSATPPTSWKNGDIYIQYE